jgi:hypothetical protein
MSYYDNQESVANIYVGLVERGWNCFGYKADESDSMTDYWSPARWEGIAEKNGFVLLIDVYSTSQSGYKVTKKGYTADFSKIAKLQATINDKAASPNEKETSQKIIDQMLAKQKESEVVIAEYPVFKNANPKGCNWHIEKDGNIIAKGKGAFQCDGYLFASYREETMKKVNAFIDKIESKIKGTEQLEAVQQEVIKKVIKPVETTVNVNNFVKDQTIIKLNSGFTGGHYKGELLQFVNSHTYNRKGEEVTTYTFVKLGKKYQQLKMHGAANNTLTLDVKNLEKWLNDSSILTMELKEVEEVIYKTVYKTVNRKGQEENLLSGEVAETVQTEAPKAPKAAKTETKKENKQTTIIKDESIQVELKLNEKLNGIELYFTGKPSEGTRELLKENGFRWSKYNKCWYTKQSDKSMLFAESLVSAYNDTITEEPETMEEVTETVITASEEANQVTEPITAEQPTNEEETPENPYNSEYVITPNGFYCHFKAWDFEPEQITELLQSSNIPFTEAGEKFFFQGITELQFKLVQMINKENGSILWDDSNEYEEPKQPENKQPKNNVIDFSSRFKTKQEKKEIDNMKTHFIDHVLPYLNNDELIELQKAHNSNDKTELDTLWNKLMMITAVRRAKHEMLKEN